MKNSPSRDQLSKSLDRRVKHLMIKTLERFEDSFPDLDNTREGQVFKGDLRTSFNDVLRAQRDELLDYEIDYRPLRMDDNNTLSMTQTFMRSVQRVTFDVISGVPSVKIYTSMDRRNVLTAVRAEFDTGVIYEDNGDIVLEIVGVKSCVDSVFMIMDRYSLHSSVRAEYLHWRSKVVEAYRRQAYG